MFNIFKQDIKIGDKVKLYLITGKEPEGIVISIGENFVLLNADDNSKNRFFDKIIGGWDILQSAPNILDNINSVSKEKSPINKKLLLEKASRLESFVLSSDFVILPNANIVEVNGTTCIASNTDFSKILILNNKIVDEELIIEIEEFQAGSIIPIVVIYYSKDGISAMANVVAKPQNTSVYINILKKLIESENYGKAKLITYILKNSFVRKNADFVIIIKEFKKVTDDFNFQNNIKINIQHPENKDNKKAYKNVEREINELIRNSKFEFVLTQIEKELNNNSIEDKYKSSLLLKKAQVYSSLNNPDASEQAYQELVLFNEKIKSSSNNLSHLYTELARLQALKLEKQGQAIESVKKALRYNPNNNFALNLLKQIEGKSSKPVFDNSVRVRTDEHLIIEAEDDSSAISKMISLDIKEHKYTHPEIIKQGGKPTAFIAKLIFDEAKKTKEVDLSEKYPIYLEAAKAFSELNVGSYDLQDYLEAVAFYSMLKGNSLFINFRNNILTNGLDVLKLTRLRDSACSYYIESLNLLSNIEPKLLLNILANYLKLNLITYHVRKQSPIDYKIVFDGAFADVFKDCLRNRIGEIEAIAYKAIVDCGASSINAWNKLANLPYGVGVLYGVLGKPKRRKEIFNLINNLEDNIINTDLKPGEFFKNTFFERRKGVKKFTEKMANLSKIEIEPYNIDILLNSWKQIEGFGKYITPTDKEVKNEIDKLLEILQPYLNRGEKERLNILIQIRSEIEKQINFINENTTFYGRTFFYGLLNKWKNEIDILLEEKITQSYPALEISIDPPYYIETNNEITAPLIIKNIGEATAEGFSLNIICESIEYDESIEIPFETEVEIAIDNKFELSIVIPPHLLSETKAVEIKITIQAIYQKKKLTSKYFEFTIEEEPNSILTYDDIPWRDGPIPKKQMFKGRKKLIADLAQHYLSIERDKPYILYGLTRTGKSSVLEYLRLNIQGDTFFSNGQEKLVLTFSWDLSEAASFKKAPDFWRYILYQQTFEEIEKYASKYSFDISGFTINENTRAKDFKIILEFLNSKHIYPMFFVDEFSFLKTLIDDGTINSAFLHTLRQFSLSELASFIFAGTYDIKSLIKDPKYGITGQLVNAIEEQINEISNEAAEELIDVINDKLSFTPEAIEHIKFLSGNVPYFIQIICKYCGYFASENKRRHIGYPELEKVIKILIGQVKASSNSLVKKLPENVFQNNQFSPVDPKEVAVLISSLTYLNKDRIADPRGIGFAELQKLWAEKNITAFRPKLAEAINLLKEKKIIIQLEDEGFPVYKLAVDLFRRWWSNHNPDIDLTLTTLT